MTEEQQFAENFDHERYQEGLDKLEAIRRSMQKAAQAGIVDQDSVDALGSVHSDFSKAYLTTEQNVFDGED